MFCQKCGQPIATGIQYCPSCGTDVSGQTAPPKSEVTPADLVRPAATASATPVAAAAASSEYAGFGLRLGAVLIDGAIGWVVSLAIQIPLGLGMGLSDFQNTDNIFAMAGIFGFAIIASFGFSWLYEALLTSSSWQATVGKKALGIIVTDENGGRISFLRATGRHFAKMLSGMLLFVGYFIQPFTPKRQALHDILAGTLVLKPGGLRSPAAPPMSGVQE
jgi:uncharacterized RDD family membrane protein YckC